MTEPEESVASVRPLPLPTAPPAITISGVPLNPPSVAPVMVAGLVIDGRADSSAIVCCPPPSDLEFQDIGGCHAGVKCIDLISQGTPLHVVTIVVVRVGHDEVVCGQHHAVLQNQHGRPCRPPPPTLDRLPQAPALIAGLRCDSSLARSLGDEQRLVKNILSRHQEPSRERRRSRSLDVVAKCPSMASSERLDQAALWSFQNTVPTL